MAPRGAPFTFGIACAVEGSPFSVIFRDDAQLS
jgi:hypothetical protein